MKFYNFEFQLLAKYIGNAENIYKAYIFKIVTRYEIWLFFFLRIYINCMEDSILLWVVFQHTFDFKRENV